MEPVKHQNHQFSNSQYSFSLKLSTIFIASMLFYSLILSCSSLLVFILSNRQFHSSNNTKNYMFLLCNGILVFLVKNSGLFSNSHEECSFTGEVKVNNGNNINPKKVGELPEVKEAVNAEEKITGEVKEVEEMEDEYLINVGEEDEQVELVGRGNGIAYPDEDGEEEAIELPSAEELNKKCEDFIRRMKEGIKLEAKQLVHY